MDKQALFNKALFGIRNQGGFSYENCCLYNSSNDARCGIGQCIDDRELRELMDSHIGAIGNIFASISTSPLPGLKAQVREALGVSQDAQFNSVEHQFLRALQEAHDWPASEVSGHSLEECFTIFEHEMEKIASIYNLTYTPPSEKL